MADNTKYYQLIDEEGKINGRYTGKSPKHAAKKASVKIVLDMQKKGETIPDKKEFILRESTRGSSREMYRFEAVRSESGKFLEVYDEGTLIE